MEGNLLSGAKLKGDLNNWKSGEKLEDFKSLSKSSND